MINRQSDKELWVNNCANHLNCNHHIINPPWLPFRERGRAVREHNVVLVILGGIFGYRSLFQKIMEFSDVDPLFKRGRKFSGVGSPFSKRGNTRGIFSADNIFINAQSNKELWVNNCANQLNCNHHIINPPWPPFRERGRAFVNTM